MRVRFLGAGAAATLAALSLTSGAEAQSRQPMWQGLYLGVHAGGVFGDMTVEDPFAKFKWDHGGAVVGGHAGYNLQFNQIVAGVEGDIAWTNANGTMSPAPGFKVDTDTDYFASIRGRLGVAFDQVLMFGTVGYGFGGFNAQFSGPGVVNPDQSRKMNGIVWGGGVEYKLTRNLSGRLEALQHTLKRTDFDATIPGDVKAKLDETIIRAGVTYHLN